MEDGYFYWLTRLIGVNDYGGKPYRMLCLALHETPYRAKILLDENRGKDGIYLRENYLMETKSVSTPMALKAECTMLEMLVALACRMEYDDEDGSCQTWFWHMIRNLGLDIFTDTLMEHDNKEKVRESIAKITDIFMERRYNKDGRGGNIFVTNDGLRNLKMEPIWRQMCFYIEEFRR